jgi:protein TonB
MRLTSFLLISFALHAAALTYPVVFQGSRADELISVVILNSGDTGGSGARGRGAEGGKPAEPKHRTSARPAKLQETKKKRESTESIEPLRTVVSTPAGPARIAVGSVAAAGTVEISSGEEASGDAETDGTSDNGISGSANGFGNGRGEWAGGSKFVPVNYAYTPRPEYPDSARREGKEGRVLLRVLVDEGGRSKSVEVNRSSGSKALDRAAAEAIKRWRFSPARNGDKAVESWVRIPIDFRLRDAHDRKGIEGGTRE